MRDESGKRLFRPKKAKDYGVEYINSLPQKNSKQIEAFRKCEQALNAICQHKYANYFKEPVDYVKLNLLDYPQIVTEPMDLGTVRKKLKAKEYGSPAEFLVDMRRIWSNCLTYNPESTLIHQHTLEIQQYFNKVVANYRNFQDDDSSSYASGGMYGNQQKLLRQDSDEYVPGTNKFGSIKGGTKGFSAQRGYNPPYGNGTNSQNRIVIDRPFSYDEKRALKDAIQGKF